MKDETTTHQPSRAGIGERIIKCLSIGMLVLLTVGLVANFSNWVATTIFAVQYPHQIDYGEGIVWQQALMILGGEGYSDITRLPFVVFHYPPVFHLLSGLFAGALNIEYLAAGRIVSVVSTLGSTTIIGVLIFRAMRAREGLMPSLLCAFAAGLTVFMFNPVAFWSPLMRVDMTAIFLSYLGVYFGLQAPERPRYVYVSALFFSLAMYTKQTAIAAPLAMLVVLTVIRPRLAGLGVVNSTGGMRGHSFKRSGQSISLFSLQMGRKANGCSILSTMLWCWKPSKPLIRARNSLPGILFTAHQNDVSAYSARLRSPLIKRSSS